VSAGADLDQVQTSGANAAQVVAHEESDMSGRYRSFSWLAGLAALLVGGLDARSDTVEPQAAFVVKNGWVECALRQNGQPVAAAVIEVMDEAGKNFAEGQTGEEGQAAFPMPRGSSFTVEIKTGKRTADPIRLFPSADGIEPARVLLSYGLRPCCRFKERSETVGVGSEGGASEPIDAHPPWQLFAAVFAALASAGAVVLVVMRQHANGSGPISR
jgi:hypothetical protein